MDNGQLWSRFAAVYKRAVTVLLLLNGTRFNAARGLAPRTCEGGAPAPAQGRGGARTADCKSINVSFRTSSLSWCGNLRRTADCIPIFMSFRTSPLNWCGNPRRTADCIPIFMSFRTSSLSWCGNLPRHCDRVLLKMEIATPVCALARKDREFHGARVVRRLAPRTCEGGVPAPAQGRGEHD